MNPELQNAYNQVKELTPLAKSNPGVYAKELDTWNKRVAQLEEHAIANSPAASALLKSDPRAYINTFGSAVDRQNINTTLPPATPPGSAGAITTGINTPQIPTTTPTAGNISGASAGTASLGTFFDTLVKQNEENARQRAEAEKTRQAETQSTLSKLMSSITSPAAARTAAQAETGITPANYFAEEKAKIEEIGKLTEEYNSVKAARDAQIAGTQDKLASMNFINNQTAQIERNAAPRLNELSANINSKAAVLQALQGRFNEAQTYVNQAVQDATANTKYQMDLFNTFYQINQDSIDRLDTIYQDAFKTKMSLAQTAYEQDVKSKTDIGNLMIKNPQAGISMTDTLEQAYAKIGLKPATSSQIIGSAETGYTNVVTDASGKIISSTPISSVGTGGKKLSTTVQNDFNEDLASISQLGTRENALVTLNNLKTSAINKYGKENYDLLVKEVDRLFPATVTTPSAPVTAYSAGQATGSVVKPLYEAFRPENLGAGIKDIAGGVKNVVTGFWTGLFGD